MHWFEQLASLYGPKDIPLYHTMMYTDIELHLDICGKLLQIKQSRHHTQVPVTERSMYRTSAIEAHPLSDRLRYLASGLGKLHHDAYLKTLAQWADSEYSTPRLVAVRDYIFSDSLCKDVKDMPVDADTAIRFVVDGVPLWEDRELVENHILNTEARQTDHGLCCITGAELPLCSSHRKQVLSPSSSAKLISHEHRSRIIHQGRFASPTNVFPISSDASFKAHTVLSRLIEQHGMEIGNRVFVAWDDTDSVPLPFAGTLPDLQGSITVLGLTEATKGRISVTFIRILSAQRYQAAVQKWHNTGLSVYALANAAFGHPVGKRYVCSEQLYGNTAERLLGCILDDTPFPSDILYALSGRSPHVLKKLTEYI